MEHLNEFIHHHWQMCLAFVVIFIVLLIHEYVSGKKQGKSLTPEAAVALINHENAVVFDLRAAELYQKGHIIQAIRASSADFDMPKMDKYKTKPIILVCTRGVEAAALATKLRTKGYQQPMVLAGGITAWQAANLPLVKK